MVHEPWIEIAAVEAANGDLKRAYDTILATRGRMPRIRSVIAGAFGVT